MENLAIDVTGIYVDKCIYKLARFTGARHIREKIVIESRQIIIYHHK